MDTTITILSYACILLVYLYVLRTKNVIPKLLQLKLGNWFGHGISYHIGGGTILNDYLDYLV